MYKFEKLQSWQESVVLISMSYELVRKLPRLENNNLADQLRRAVTSIALNIAEGAGAENDRELLRYLHIARKSTYEVVAIIKIINQLYPNLVTVDVEIQLEKQSKLLSGLIRYLKPKDKKSSDKRLIIGE